MSFQIKCPSKTNLSTWALPTAWGNCKPKQDVFLKGGAGLPYFLLIKSCHPPGCYCFAPEEEQLKFNLRHLILQVGKSFKKPKRSQALLTTVLYNFWCFFISFASASIPKLLVFFPPLVNNDLGQLLFNLRLIPSAVSSVLCNQKCLLNRHSTLRVRCYYLHFTEEKK